MTGAGNGLGKAYALELGRRGCAVCVNDLGGSVKGDALEEDAPRPADLVVQEIVDAGGTAVASECFHVVLVHFVETDASLSSACPFPLE